MRARRWRCIRPLGASSEKNQFWFPSISSGSFRFLLLLLPPPPSCLPFALAPNGVIIIHSSARAQTGARSHSPTARQEKEPNTKKCPLLYIYIYILLAFYLFQTRNIFLLHGIVDGSIYTAVPWRATGISIFPNCSGKNISIQDRRTEELKKRERLELDTPWPRKPPFFFSFVCNS